MSEVKVDTISERTTDAGVTVEGVKIEDGVATFQTAAGSPLVFEGATADAYETTFAITDPTADRTITFPDADVTLGAATLAPAFSVCTNAVTAIASATNTKIVLDREIFDSNSAFDATTNYRFTVPADEDGKYFFSAAINFIGTSYSGVTNIQTMLYLNGSEHGTTSSTITNQANTTALTLNGSWILDLSVADYIELFGYWLTDGTAATYNGNATLQKTHLLGFKMVGI